MHIKPGRFPRNTKGKKKYSPYYSPKPDSPWYKIVEEALAHPGWKVGGSQDVAQAPTLDDVLSEEVSSPAAKEKEAK